MPATTIDRRMALAVLMLLLGSLATLTGMFTGCSLPINAEIQTQVMALPDAERAAIHVELVNSPIDPIRLGRLGRVAANLRAHGLPNAHFRAWPSGDALADFVRATRTDNPDARLILVGWSGASLAVWDALTALDTDGIRVDHIIYLDSNWIKTRIRERGHPTNYDDAVLIYRASNPPPEVERATLIQIPTGNHLAVPAHPAAVAAILRTALSTR